MALSGITKYRKQTNLQKLKGVFKRSPLGEIMKIVKDKRTLNAIKKAGFIKEPKYCSFPRVDEVEQKHFIFGFSFKNKKYKIKYFEGNFYPYLIEV